MLFFLSRKKQKFEFFVPFSGKEILGLAKANGRDWSDQRKFMLRRLGDLGVGKRDTMEEVIGQAR